MTIRTFVEANEFGGPEVLRVHSGPVPEPGPAEVVVAVRAIGVNFADTMVRRGEYRRDQVLPQTPGMEVAGTIHAVGVGVEMEPGTPVAVFLESLGGYASHVVVPQSLVFPVEDEIAPELVAASFLQGVTAWYAVHRYGRVGRGDRVLVSGAAGGLGAWTVQLALEAGAYVVGLGSTQDKRHFLTELGCAVALDPGADDLTSALRTSSPGGFDVICDGVGGPLFDAMLPALAANGRYVVTGSASQAPAMIDTRRLMPRGQTVCGFIVRNVIDADPAEPAAAMREVLRRAATGSVRVEHEVMPMSEVVEAHRRLEQRGVSGKLVLTP